MKNLVITFFFLLFIKAICAQAPSIKIWDRRWGGTNDEIMGAFQQTTDGGYILGGASNSRVSGNKTQPDWDTILTTSDYWAIKIDSDGNKQWDKRFGGTGDEGLYALQQTKDGGYILGGLSGSGVGGDRTQPGWGGWDFWIVKIDSLGNKEWDKRFGGTADDLLYALNITKDNGFILSGYSKSSISGDKTQPCWGGWDYWVVKTDSLGNKQWDKRFGGTGQDAITSVIQTSDDGYLLGGISDSDSTGDVSQHTFGGSDYWVVKIDSLGNKQWDKRYGGSGNEQDAHVSLIQLADGNYLISSSSGSLVSGNKTQPPCGDNDYWVVKTDTAGNIIWDKVYGGLGEDEFNMAVQTMDGGFLFSGSSSSIVSCEKSEDNLGGSQCWIVKTDSLGNKEWDKTILTKSFDIDGFAIQTKEGCFVVGLSTQAGTGGYKTQSNWDTTGQTADYWIVKFCYTGFGEAVKDLTNNLQLNIYPNPFTSELDISIAQPNLREADFSICNILGQTVYTQHETNLSSTYTKMLDLRYLPNGVYLVEVVVDGEVSVREVVKQ